MTRGSKCDGGGHGVAGVNGVVEPRTQKRIAARHEKALAKIDCLEIRIEHLGADELVVVSLDASEVNKERRLSLHEWTTQIHVVVANLKRRAFTRVDRERIA